jgi:hypothetical protein
MNISTITLPRAKIPISPMTNTFGKIAVRSAQLLPEVTPQKENKKFVPDFNQTVAKKPPLAVLPKTNYINSLSHAKLSQTITRKQTHKLMSEVPKPF